MKKWYVICSVVLAAALFAANASAWGKKKDAAKPEFAKLDFKTVPVPVSDQEKVTALYEKLVDAVNRKDRDRIIDYARQLDGYGCREVAIAGYTAAADACANPDELMKLADGLLAQDHPAAYVLYASAVYGAIKAGDAPRVEVLAAKMAPYGAVRSAWFDAARYLIKEAEKKKDIPAMTRHARGLFLQGDTDGAKMGFAACCAAAKDAKARLQAVKEFTDFGYSLMTDKETAAFFDEALAAGDDEAALRMLDQLRRMGSEKSVDLTIKYVDAVPSRNVPIEYAVRASIPLAMMDAADVYVGLLDAWKRIAQKAEEKGKPEDIERVADFIAEFKSQAAAAYAAVMYERLMKRDPKTPLIRKIKIMEKARFRLGKGAELMLMREASPLMKEALAAHDAAAIEIASRTLVAAGKPELVALGIEGYAEIEKMFREAKNSQGLIVLGGILAAASTNAPEAGKLAARAYEEGFRGIDGEGVPLTQLKMTADVLTRTNDPALVKLARDAVLRRLQGMTAEPLQGQCDAAALALGSADPELQKAAKAMLLEIAGKAKTLKSEVETLLLAQAFIQLPDRQLRGAGIALLKQLVEQQRKEKKFSEGFMINLNESVRRSGDPELQTLLEEKKE